MRRTALMSTIACLSLGLAACGTQEAAPSAPANDAVAPATADAATASVTEGNRDAAPTASPSTEEYDVASRELDNTGATPVAGSCLAEVGREKAEALSQQCNQISTATRPPCNIQNSCQQIRAEIKRGCEFGDGADNPAFCEEQ